MVVLLHQRGESDSHMRHQNGDVVTVGESVSVCVGAREELKASSTRSTHCTTEPCLWLLQGFIYATF